MLDFLCICCSTIWSLVQFCPFYCFYSIHQNNRTGKFEPEIKLYHNIFIYKLYSLLVLLCWVLRACQIIAILQLQNDKFREIGKQFCFCSEERKLWFFTPKCTRLHFRESSFQNFMGEHVPGDGCGLLPLAAPSWAPIKKEARSTPGNFPDQGTKRSYIHILQGDVCTIRDKRCAIRNTDFSYLFLFLFLLLGKQSYLAPHNNHLHNL